VGRWLRTGFAHIGDRPPVVRATVVGLLSGVLPCGWLWAFVVTAAGTGHALTGAAVMAAFWAGTVPALVAVGLGSQLVGGRLRRHVPAVTAVLLVVLGVVALVGRPASVDAAISDREAADANTTAHPSDVPCCDR
jgi:sulfite exporter TauE/SafE